MPYFFGFIGALALAALITPLVGILARRWSVLDIPGPERKIHTRPTPLLGGIAVWAAFLIIMWYVALQTPYLLGFSIKLKHLIGISLGSLVLMIGGYADDKYNLKPWKQLVFSVVAVLIIIASGIGIRKITNPFGGTLSLVSWEYILFWFHGIAYRISLPADLLAFVWLMGMIYTTKVLDGLDGLVSGISVIGAFMIMFLATTTKYFQPEVGMLAAIVAGAFAGFLLWNFNPARIFLGTGGSTLAGFLLGILAIISGGKIATTLLVLGIPVLDTAWVVFRRIFWERKSPAIGDRKHLHFRLLDAGFSHRGAVLLLWLISLAFGISTLFLQSKEKLITLCVLAAVMALLAGWVVVRYRASRNT